MLAKKSLSIRRVGSLLAIFEFLHQSREHLTMFYLYCLIWN